MKKRKTHLTKTKKAFLGKESKKNNFLNKIKKLKKIFKNITGNKAKKWKKAADKKNLKNNKIKLPFVKNLFSLKSKIPKPVKIFLKIILFPIRNKYARYALLALITLIMIGIAYLLKDLPSPRKLTSSEHYAVSTQIFDRNGAPLYEIFADENRVPINIDDMPPHLLEATIAIEDQRFYKHFGIDFIGTLRALKNNLQGQPIEGGSTITQQLVKNALLTREKTITRKVKEAALAVITELIYSKEQILEMYLNYIPYGGTAVGIESASQQYFDKHAKDLNLAESSLLAGLPQAPSTYSPFGSNPQRAKDRQAQVLNRMVEDGYIKPLEAENAKAETLTYAISKTDIAAPHFVFYVRDLLYEKYGVETVEKGGLRVSTTLDLELQEVAQASLSAEVNKLANYRVGNGAAMITKPNTGEILAMIGSKDYFDEEAEGEVNVTIAERQPGSSIKPLMYATAFQEKLLNPGTILLDIPTCFEVPGQKPYCPRNYNGGYSGPVTVRHALANSLNIPAVKGIRIIGVETFINQARKMGITSWIDPSRYGLSLTLGGGEVRMIDMAQAFGVLANQGVKVPLTPILKVENYQGEIFEELDIDERLDTLDYLTEYEDDSKQNNLERVMDRAPAYLASHIMQDNKARTPVFGARSSLVISDQIVSAKTGTTNDLKDNWTVGFTPEFLVITWVGNNDNSPMNQYLVSGITGAAPIFNDIMTFVLEDHEPIWQEKPSSIASAPVCASGLPPTSGDKNCQTRDTELYWQKSEPSDSKLISKEVWIKASTGLPPKPGEPEDDLQLQQKIIYVDPLTKEYCSDCARATDDEGKVIYEKYNVSNQISSTTETN